MENEMKCLLLTVKCVILIEGNVLEKKFREMRIAYKVPVVQSLIHEH